MDTQRTRIQILLIEDEEYDARRINNTLKQAGDRIQVRDIVSNGKAALDVLRSHPGVFDVAIMDFQIAGGLILIGLAGVRTLYPLQYTEHQSELARLRVKITEAEAAGEALDYPIPVPEFAPLKVRYYFGDDFDITVMRQDGGLSFFLYPKDNS